MSRKAECKTYAITVRNRFSFAHFVLVNLQIAAYGWASELG